MRNEKRHPFFGKLREYGNKFVYDENHYRPRFHVSVRYLIFINELLDSF